ncbi:FRIGIDA-like protein 3 [Tanacetum coccineum]
MDTITTAQPPFNLKNLNLPPPQPPPSIAELRHISAALSQFLRDYDDLHSHIGSVNAAIDEKLSLHFKGNAVNFNDFALTPIIVDDYNNNVLEGSIVEPNPRRSVSQCVLSDDDDDDDDSNVLKGAVSVRKRNQCVLSDDDDDSNVLKGVVSVRKRNQCVLSDDDDDSNVLKGVVSVRKRKQCVSSDDDDDDDSNVLKGVVSVRKRNQCVSSDDDDDSNVLKGVVSVRKPNQCVSSDDDDGSNVLKGVVSVRKRNQCVLSDDDDDSNVLKGVVSLRKRNQCVSSDDDDDSNVLKGVVSVRKRNQCVSSDDDDSNVLKGVVSVRKRNQCVSSDDDDDSNVLKGVVSVRKRNQCVLSDDSEETDDEDGEIEAPKKPEDADYDRIVTELLEDVDVVPKRNRTASDSDHEDKPEVKNHEQADVSVETYVSEKHEEMDILKNPAESGASEKPEEIDIAKNPEEADVSEKPEYVEILKNPKPAVSELEMLEKHEEMDILKNPAESDVSEKPEEIDIAENPEETDVSEKPEEADVSEKPEYVEILKNPKPAVSELEMLCKSMSGRKMKKYVVKHISNIDKLRTELSKALKLAINPAKLVLDSIGTYFLESSKTYHWGSFQCLKDQIDGRVASVLILECFVMISGDGIEISREDEAYAAEDANHWKTRMINEGLEYTEEADARGLLLFISGFGISDRFFSTGDIMNLMRASNVKGISNILRRSIVLMPKIPEVIDMMVMSKLEVKAADIAYTFGLEDKCHPLTILTKFLRSIIDDIESGSPVPKAMKQHLDDLTSVKECLESHDIDPSKVLPEFKIDEEIHHLKKELKLQVQKRKAMDIESLPNPNHQQAKRTCLSRKTMPRGISLYSRSMQSGHNYRDFNLNLSSNYIPPSFVNAPALPVNTTNSVTSGLAGPNDNIWPYGWQDESALAEKYLVQPYPRQSQTYDTQPSLTRLYGRRPGFPVCMSGRPRYPGYFPADGFPARRGPGSDLYAFADVVEKGTRGSRAVGSGTGYSFMKKYEVLRMGLAIRPESHNTLFIPISLCVPGTYILTTYIELRGLAVRPESHNNLSIPIDIDYEYPSEVEVQPDLFFITGTLFDHHRPGSLMKLVPLSVTMILRNPINDVVPHKLLDFFSGGLSERLCFNPFSMGIGVFCLSGADKNQTSPDPLIRDSPSVWSTHSLFAIHLLVRYMWSTPGDYGGTARRYFVNEVCKDLAFDGVASISLAFLIHVTMLELASPVERNFTPHRARFYLRNAQDVAFPYV